MLRISNLLASVAAPLLTVIVLTACGGGGDDSPVSKASFDQTAPAGSLTVQAGQTEAAGSIHSVSHQVGNKLSRVSISAKITNARSSAGATAAGTRWVLREDGNIVAQGPLSSAPAAGASTSATYEIAVTGGATVSIEITGHVTGPAGTTLQWDGATLSMAVSPV